MNEGSAKGEKYNRKERETLEDKTREKKLELNFSWHIMFGIVPLDFAFLDYSKIFRWLFRDKRCTRIIRHIGHHRDI